MVVIGSIDTAETVLLGRLNFGEEFDDAVRFLLEHNPHNPVLTSILGEVYVAEDGSAQLSEAQQNALRGEKLKRVKEYFLDVLQKNDFELQRFEEAERAFKEVTGREFGYDDLNEKALLKDDGSICQNIDALDTQAKSLPHLDATIGILQGRMNVIGNDGNEVNQARKTELFGILREAAVEKAKADLADDSVRGEEKLDDVATGHLLVDAYHIAAASGVDVNKNVEDNAENNCGERLFNGHSTADVKEEHFLNSVIKSEERVEEKTQSLVQRGHKKAAAKMKKALAGLREKVNKVFGKAAKVKRAVAQYAKDNKWRIGVNFAASVGVLAATTVSLPVAVAALASYSIYQSQSSGWDVLAKQKRLQREASENGEDVNKWRGFAGFRNAINSIKANPKERKRFSNKRKVNVAAAGASLVLIGVGTAALATGGAVLGVTGAAAVMAMKYGASAARLLGANINAWLTVRGAKKDFKEEATAENARALKQAKFGLGLSLLGTAVTEYFAYDNLSSHLESSNTMNHVAENSGNGGNGGNGGDVQDDSAKKGEMPKVETKSEQIPVPTIEEKYTEEMLTSDMPQEDWNISKSEWKFIQRTLPGYLGTEEGAEHMAVAQEELVEAIQEKLANIEAYAKANPGVWGDLTPMQVLTKGLRHLAYSAQAVSDGDTHLINPGEDFIIWGDTKEEMAAMKSWYEVVICGKMPTEVPDNDAMQWALARMTESGNMLDKAGNVIDMSGGNRTRMIAASCRKIVFIREAEPEIHAVEELEEPVLPEPVEIKLPEEGKAFTAIVEDVPQAEGKAATDVVETKAQVTSTSTHGSNNINGSNSTAGSVVNYTRDRGGR